MWVCVRKKKKKAKMRQRERKRERGREDLFNREDWGGECHFLFFFQERDDRWKERLRREKNRKKETKGSDIKRKRGSDESEWEGSATETPLTCIQV